MARHPSRLDHVPYEIMMIMWCPPSQSSLKYSPSMEYSSALLSFHSTSSQQYSDIRVYNVFMLNTMIWYHIEPCVGKTLHPFYLLPHTTKPHVWHHCTRVYSPAYVPLFRGACCRSKGTHSQHSRAVAEGTSNTMKPDDVTLSTL